MTTPDETPKRPGFTGYSMKQEAVDRKLAHGNHATIDAVAAKLAYAKVRKISIWLLNRAIC
jgi:hypothetical protein